MHEPTNSITNDENYHSHESFGIWCYVSVCVCVCVMHPKTLIQVARKRIRRKPGRSEAAALALDDGGDREDTQSKQTKNIEIAQVRAIRLEPITLDIGSEQKSNCIYRLGPKMASTEIEPTKLTPEPKTKTKTQLLWPHPKQCDESKPTTCQIESNDNDNRDKFKDIKHINCPQTNTDRSKETTTATATYNLQRLSDKLNPLASAKNGGGQVKKCIKQENYGVNINIDNNDGAKNVDAREFSNSKKSSSHIIKTEFKLGVGEAEWAEVKAETEPKVNPKDAQKNNDRCNEPELSCHLNTGSSSGCGQRAPRTNGSKSLMLLDVCCLAASKDAVLASAASVSASMDQTQAGYSTHRVVTRIEPFYGRRCCCCCGCCCYGMAQISRKNIASIESASSQKHSNPSSSLELSKYCTCLDCCISCALDACGNDSTSPKSCGSSWAQCRKQRVDFRSKVSSRVGPKSDIAGTRALSPVESKFASVAVGNRARQANWIGATTKRGQPAKEATESAGSSLGPKYRPSNMQINRQILGANARLDLGVDSGPSVVSSQYIAMSYRDKVLEAERPQEAKDDALSRAQSGPIEARSTTLADHANLNQIYRNDDHLDHRANNNHSKCQKHRYIECTSNIVAKDEICDQLAGSSSSIGSGYSKSHSKQPGSRDEKRLECKHIWAHNRTHLSREFAPKSEPAKLEQCQPTAQSNVTGATSLLESNHGSDNPLSQVSASSSTSSTTGSSLGVDDNSSSAHWITSQSIGATQRSASINSLGSIYGYRTSLQLDNSDNCNNCSEGSAESLSFSFPPPIESKRGLEESSGHSAKLAKSHVDARQTLQPEASPLEAPQWESMGASCRSAQHASVNDDKACRPTTELDPSVQVGKLLRQIRNPNWNPELSNELELDELDDELNRLKSPIDIPQKCQLTEPDKSCGRPESYRNPVETQTCVEQRDQTKPSNIGSRSLALRRKFQALGQLVSFVQTSRNYFNSSSSSAESEDNERIDDFPTELATSLTPIERRITKPDVRDRRKLAHGPQFEAPVVEEVGERGSKGVHLIGDNVGGMRKLDQCRSVSSNVDSKSDICEQTQRSNPKMDKILAGKPKSNAHQNSRSLSMAKQSECDRDRDKDLASSQNSNTISNMNKLRRSQRANADIRREKKAAKTLAIITGVFVCCWLPFFVNAIVMPICGPVCAPSDLVFSVLLWLGYLNSLLNPLIYTIFSPDFRRAFRRLLCWP